MRRAGLGILLAIGATFLAAFPGVEAADETLPVRSGMDALLQTAEEPEPEPEPETTAASIALPDEDYSTLCRIAMAEAEGEGVTGKALVIRVILNRIDSPDFPDSIQSVIFQPGQFSTVVPEGRYYTVSPDDECREALEMVLGGWDESRGALYFESYTNGADSWHAQHLTMLFQYGGHRFYR